MCSLMIACLFHGLHCVAFDLELKERNTNGITISVFSEKKLTREPSEALAQLAEDSSTAADPFPRITGRWPPSESMNLLQCDHDFSDESPQITGAWHLKKHRHACGKMESPLRLPEET